MNYEGISISTVPCLIKIRREFFTVLNAAHLFHWSIFIFKNNPQAHTCICPILAQVYKLNGSRNLVLAFTTIHSQCCAWFLWTAPLPHFLLMLHSHPCTSLMYRANRCDDYHGCMFDHFLTLRHFTDMLHSLYFIPVLLCQLVGNFMGGGETFSAHKNCMALHLDARRMWLISFIS